MKRTMSVSLAILVLSLLATVALAQAPSSAVAPASSATPPSSATPSATAPEGAGVNAKPSPPPAEQPVSLSRAFIGMTFTKDYNAGTKDASGQFMAGTETMRILAHQGKLFAGLDDWTDKPYWTRSGNQAPWTGPQVIVKDSATAPWRVDVSFPTGHALRIEGLTEATFVTDGSGHKLDQPVKLLVVSPSAKDIAAWTRDDATGKWTKTVVVEGVIGGFRSFGMHLDKVTGVQYLFGGVPRGIFKAVYDPAAPGKLRWNNEPELSGTGRIMCFAEADGVLYAAAGIKSESPLSGGLFRRVDGEKPHWELLWRWPHVIQKDGDELEIMRGLTAVPDPKGGPHQCLIGTCNYPGVIYRIDPSHGCAATTELDTLGYFAKAFGVATMHRPCLSAYNNFLPATDPDTGEKVFLMGLWINHPDGSDSDKGASAWYVVRHADCTYSHGRVFDPKNPRPNPPRGLLATRTIELSPFPEDKGRVFYFGGYDCARRDSHFTAWIYKGVLPPTKGEVLPPPKAKE